MKWDKPTIIMAAMFVFVGLLSLTITPVFVDEGMQAFEDEESLLNPLWYMAMIVLLALGILFLIKMGFKNVIRGIIFFVFFMAISYVIYPFTSAYLQGDTSEEWTEMDFGEDVVAIELFHYNEVGGKEIAVLRENGDLEIHGRWGLKRSFSNVTDISAPAMFHNMLLMVRSGELHVMLDGEITSAGVNDPHLEILSSSVFDLPSFEGNGGADLFVVVNENASMTSLILLEGPDDPVRILSINDTHGSAAFISGHMLLAGNNITSWDMNDSRIIQITEIPNASVTEFGDYYNDTALLTVNGTLYEINATLSRDKIVKYKHPIRHVEAIDMWGGDKLEIIVLEGDRVHVLYGDGYETDWVITDILGDLEAVDADAGEWDDDDDTIELFVVADGKVYMVEIFTGEHTFRDMLVSPQFIASIIAMVLATALTGLLWLYPEWYILDTLGVIIAAGIASLIGISFAVLPAIILLCGLIVYDAVAVYQSKHMIELADTAVEQHLPLLVVIPKEKGYSYLDQGSIKEQIDKGEEREAMFLGLGDLIIPTVLVVSSFRFLDASVAFGPIAGNLAVALGTMVGILAGFVFLSMRVAGGKPQAGLPFLNTGALAGYFVSAAIVYHSVGFM